MADPSATPPVPHRSSASRRGRWRWRLASLTVAATVAALTAVPLAAGAEDDVFVLDAPVFDIEATPDGSILAAGATSVVEIGRRGVRHLGDVPVVVGATVNGVAAIGRGDAFVTSGGPDLAVGAGVWHVTRGGARLIADIEAFETANDPDAFAGPRWKDQRCEEDPDAGFSAGPQSNPFHLAKTSGSSALVADAAGNTLLATSMDGSIDLVAVFTPPVDEHGDWRVLFTLPDGTDCYVQPVPTSVDVGPDGATYVGELTGAPAVPGWSRVWRIEPGARGVVCPSAACTQVVSDLTSVMDVAFGPDGGLYVVEFDTDGWLAPLLGGGAGGTVKRCDVATGDCEVVADGLVIPGAITFDRDGELWVLENGLAAPVVRRIDLP